MSQTASNTNPTALRPHNAELAEGELAEGEPPESTVREKNRITPPPLVLERVQAGLPKTVERLHPALDPRCELEDLPVLPTPRVSVWYWLWRAITCG